MNGTDFQIKVWKELMKIPHGETRSYKEVAMAIGHPNSARAVANACSSNPYPINVPCHRVVKSDGSIGGYSGKGGIGEKRRLLANERAIQANAQHPL
ncbi:MAG: methylated-DNA--[protein]-cysteine S-methyltransferase [Candidatus Thalassarchaeaceae archaeon]|jgi:methylated-DNA-[protein]-cysteine S-methyltransferase|nr:methylated-DNA--[protein]-cysteine S-methyltransferase [Candidatus Thalassarchaeaceae archaeon]MEE2629321.1 methylated-DNA--[protein]-cysteine S-methyltransferase [Candidatus Thermoplasmatota archaeon]